MAPIAPMALADSDGGELIQKCKVVSIPHRATATTMASTWHTARPRRTRLIDSPAIESGVMISPHRSSSISLCVPPPGRTK